MSDVAPGPLADLQRVAMKIFLTDDSRLDPRDVVPVFHRWIQTHAVDGLLIDVADYTHMTSGPSVLLVAHEGHYALDLTGGRLGLQYARRVPLAEALPARLRRLATTLGAAGRLLETDTTLAGTVSFAGNEIECLANDRLLAPNQPETLAAFRPALDTLLSTLAPSGEWTVTRTADTRERFGVLASTPDEASLETLAGRLS